MFHINAPINSLQTHLVLIVRFQSSPLTLVLCSSHEIHKGLRQSSQKAAVLSERPPRAHAASQSWAPTLLRGRGEDAGQQGRTRSCRSRLRNITQLAGKANPWCQRSDRKSAAPGTLRGWCGRAESSVTELEELRGWKREAAGAKCILNTSLHGVTLPHPLPIPLPRPLLFFLYLFSPKAHAGSK